MFACQPQVQPANCDMTQYWSSENYSYEEQNLQPYQPLQYNDDSCHFIGNPGSSTTQPLLHQNYDYHFASGPECHQYVPLTPEPVTYPAFELTHSSTNVMTKKHRAQIALVPTSNGSFKAIVKRKRKRTIFTTEQIQSLEEIFKTKQYITRDYRQVIVKNLNLNDKAVKIWFQNRRLKDKRIPEELSSPQSIEDQKSPIESRLDNVEYQINEKTNELGYVTLDDDVMGDLATVLNDFLTNEDLNEVPTKAAEIDNFYEPISPASICDGHEEDPASWKPAEPNESLQRLFDLQTMLAL